MRLKLWHIHPFLQYPAETFSVGLRVSNIVQHFCSQETRNLDEEKTLEAMYLSLSFWGDQHGLHYEEKNDLMDVVDK